MHLHITWNDLNWNMRCLEIDSKSWNCMTRHSWLELVWKFSTHQLLYLLLKAGLFSLIAWPFLCRLYAFFINQKYFVRDNFVQRVFQLLLYTSLGRTTMLGFWLIDFFKLFRLLSILTLCQDRAPASTKSLEHCLHFANDQCCWCCSANNNPSKLM